jgi:hypothetical protein
VKPDEMINSIINFLLFLYSNPLINKRIINGIKNMASISNRVKIDIAHRNKLSKINFKSNSEKWLTKIYSEENPLK